MKHTLILSSLFLAGTIFAAERIIVRDIDRFELIYEMTLPKLTSTAKLWIPLARTDPHQKFNRLSITSPVPWQKTHDAVHHNELLVIQPGPAASGKCITICYQVTRLEKKTYTKVGDPKQHLKAEKLVPLDIRFIGIAMKLTEDIKGDRARGKKLYQHVLKHMHYDKSGKGWGRGDALYACDTLAGNCTDFHAYFIALCRAIKIPARFAIGLAIPADRDQGAINGYHCWAEFYADGKWVPVDISEAQKHPDLAEYYFGHHPANRLELTRGRDIAVQPMPKAGPFNYCFGPHLEVGGQEVPVKVTFEFRRLPRK